MNERTGYLINTVLQMAGMVPPDTVKIGEREININLYMEAKECAEQDPRVTEFISNIILEYVDRIEEDNKKQRERIRAEIETEYALKRNKKG